MICIFAIAAIAPALLIGQISGNTGEPRDADDDPINAPLPAGKYTFTWERVAKKGPEARFSHAMAYHIKEEKVVLFGGRTISNGWVYLNDTWLWDGKNWQNVSTDLAPSARSGHSMSYDPETKAVVLFGGYDGQNLLGDTWIFKNNKWRAVDSADAPSPRMRADMVYDQAREEIVLYGGNQLSPTDIWIWKDRTWMEITPGGLDDVMPSRNGPALAYDERREMIYMFGGEVYPGRGGWVSSETWQWDGENWTRLEPARNPRASDDRRMVYNPQIGATILFGGQVSEWDGDLLTWVGTSETWKFNGRSWRELKTTIAGGLTENDLKRGRHAMVYDRARGQIVVFGGIRDNSPLSDTWVLDIQKK